MNSGALSLPNNARLVAARTVVDTLYESLKRETVENRIEPGSILTEQTIAARHSVSRTSAREALKRLVASGFVNARHRVGYLVTHVSLVDVNEVFTLRLLLEPLATELAVPRLTKADIEILDRLASGVLRVAGAPVVEHGSLYSRLNADFHREIARVSGNRRLQRSIAGLIDELERVMHMLAYSPAIKSLLAEHSTLVRVMASGDAIAAGRLMRDQLERDYSMMSDLVTRRGAPEA